MILLLRSLPFLIGVMQLLFFRVQILESSTFPWIAVVGWILVPVAAIAISWGRISFSDLMHKMTPTFVTLACMVFGLLLVEGSWQFWLLASLASIVTFTSLELVFLLSYDPAAYPVHGISRVNVGYVPLAIWYATSTSVGVMTFIHMPAIWHLVLMACLGAILFRTTGHPDATAVQMRTWTILGTLVGVEVGLLGIFLPVGMQAQGLFAAVLFSAALRTRRYLYDPKPSNMIAYIEGAAAMSIFVIALSTAQWT